MAQFEEVGVKAVVQGYDKFIFEIGNMNKSIVGLSGTGSLLASGMGIATAAIGVFVAAVGGAVAVIGGITTALYKIGAASVETATSFESSFAGILKTTNDLGTNLYDLTDAGEVVFQQFRDLAKDIPLSFEELAKIGEFAGQLGIPESALASFTKTVAALGVSTELTTEQAALGLARIANVYGVTADDMASNTERMGSTLAFLGNNFAAMEDEILIFSRNIAGTTAALGITQDELFAIGTAFTAAGNTAEAGGSSVQRILLEMSKAVQAGGKDLNKWAEATGMTAEQFATQWSQDGGAAKTFLAFMQNLGAQGEGASQVLADLDVDTIRVLRTMLSAAGSVDILEQALAGASTAWEENTALTREAEIRYNTFESQVEMVKNRFRDMATTIGLELIPLFGPLMNEVLDPFMEGLEMGLPGAIDTVVGALENDLIPSLIDLATRMGLTDPQSVADGIQNIADVISENIGKFSEFVDSITKEDLATIATNLGNMATNMGEFLETVSNEDTIRFFTDLIGVVSDLYAALELVILSFRALGEYFETGAFKVETFEAWMDARERALGIAPVEFTEEDLISPEEIQARQEAVYQASLLGYGEGLREQYTGQSDDSYNVGQDQGRQVAEGFQAGYDEEIAKFGDSWFEAATSTTEQYSEGLQEQIPIITETIGESMDTALSDVPPYFEEPMQDWQTELDTQIDTIMTEIEPTAKSGGFAVGVAIMEGVKLGILAKAEVIATTAANAVNAAIAAAEEAAGIDSPSKEGIRIGDMFATGINIGILDNIAQLQDTVISGMTAMISAGQSIMPQTVNNNTQSVDRSFNVGDINMVTNEKSPYTVADNLSLLAELGG